MIDDRKQWFLLWFMATWLLVALLLAIITFWLTRNLLSLSVFSTLAPPAIMLRRITRTLFPPGDNETKIAIEKRQRKGL